MVTACLRSLSQQTLSHADFEVLVIENEGRDQDPAPEIPQDLAVQRVLLRENLGTTGSINHALTLSESRYVLLLNNDVELVPAFLQVLGEVLEKDSELGFATPKLLQATDRTRLDGAGDALLLGGGAYRLGHTDLDSPEFSLPGEAIAGCGAATMYRRAMMVEAGGLDEDFFAYLEDMDLSLRAHLLGWKGAYVPSAVAYHIGGATLGSSIHPRIIQLTTRNQLLLLIKNYPASLLFRLAPRILLFQCLWMAYAVKRRALGACLRGILEFLRLLPRALRKRSALNLRRKITTNDFLRLLRTSERQIVRWHFGRRPEERSKLLNTYFRLFTSARQN